MATRVTVTFMTRYGLGFVARWYMPDTVVSPDDSAITDIVDAINAACACVGISIELSKSHEYAGSAGTGALTCEDKVVLLVKDEDGQENHVFKVPAPKIAAGNSIFEADQATLDLEDANVEALSDALALYGRGKSGDGFGVITKGHRAGGKALSY